MESESLRVWQTKVEEKEGRKFSGERRKKRKREKKEEKKEKRKRRKREEKKKKKRRERRKPETKHLRCVVDVV